MSANNAYVQLRGKAYMWDQKKRKAHNVHEFASNADILNAIQTFSEPSDSIVTTFEHRMRGKIVLNWTQEWVTATAPIYVASTQDDVCDVLDDMDSLANALQDGAPDGYLEGDAVMYTDTKSDTNYEFVLEMINISLIIKRLHAPKKTFKVLECAYNTYWKE